MLLISEGSAIYIYRYINKVQNLISVKQCSIHRRRAEYIYRAEKKQIKRVSMGGGGSL